MAEYGDPTPERARDGQRVQRAVWEPGRDGSEPRVDRFLRRGVPPVDPRRQLAAGSEDSHERLEGRSCRGRVMKDADRVDEIESPGSERKPQQIGLNHLHVGERGTYVPRPLHGLGDVDGDDAGAETG